ncbi:MAG: hydroxymethylglutaryl-CoA lyase [Sneathiellaceae bacterium]
MSDAATSAPEVILNECFARDGLQNEPDFVATETKIALIDRFTDLGFRRIEASSYSNPKVVPQFADASAVLAGIRRGPGTYYKGTCANLRAVERANADTAAGHGPSEISLLASASEAHSQKNLRATKAEQWQRIAEMAAAAGGRYRIVGSLSVVFGCPFEGRVPEAVVLEDCRRFAALGIRHVSLGDTTGMATPPAVARLFGHLADDLPEVTAIAHFHDSRGTGIANCIAALEAGCRHFDCSLGGVGGHPAKVRYGGGHTGNVATEDLANLLEAMGVRTGLDMDGLLATVEACEAALGRRLHGRTARAGLSPLIARP